MKSNNNNRNPMTNAEIIATIRAEIVRLKNTDGVCQNNNETADIYYARGVRFTCEALLSFLSNLGKFLPTEVTNDEILGSEIVNYSFDSCPNLSPSLMIMANFARHFYELGCRCTAEKYDELEYNRQRAEVSEKPMNLKGLEKEIEEYFPESAFNTGFNYDDLQEIARHFAQWGAEHLKK